MTICPSRPWLIVRFPSCCAARLGASWGDWLERLAALREEAKERIEGSAGREAFWRAALSEHILNLVEEDRLDEAEAEIRHALDCFGTES